MSSQWTSFYGPKVLEEPRYAKKLNKKDGWEVDDAFYSP
ncbi:hypothetical protein COLO4_20717 [Corchorus olitorius]|uniref:Uncharacterized protein n=1 Tax=Corchorus olitorius TaxID=93759 RepID=A0A1R3IXE2_9ROSI|nr:hypothetical protein COLO4_20717 [Corchorus olitorius]